MPRKKPEANEAKASKLDSEVLTFTEAHLFLRVSHQTIYKLIEQGLPSHKVGKRRVFLKEDLLKWIREH